MFAFDTSDAPLGLENHWGYSPVNWFTPHQFFVSKGSTLSPRDQFRKLVSTCHDNGIEVILDVVYNHTREGNENGPTISWKGFGESFYYHQDKDSNFLDVTGCGNSIAANRPIVRKLIIECLQHEQRGHVGSSMSLVEIIRVLYDDIMKFKTAGHTMRKLKKEKMD